MLVIINCLSKEQYYRYYYYYYRYYRYDGVPSVHDVPSVFVIRFKTGTA
ncbi:MAG: hypothetical protein ACD_62C00544G0014 [uncultured bacterium]|nr:MAG: hypothetical protein ACD_62C00544G0014 [uncultured bacterium]HLD46044.1 hypothetical protein [bacterium]